VDAILQKTAASLLISGPHYKGEWMDRWSESILVPRILEVRHFMKDIATILITNLIAWTEARFDIMTVASAIDNGAIHFLNLNSNLNDTRDRSYSATFGCSSHSVACAKIK
jgi:hypothetical protein